MVEELEVESLVVARAGDASLEFTLWREFFCLGGGRMEFSVGPSVYLIAGTCRGAKHSNSTVAQPTKLS